MKRIIPLLIAILCFALFGYSQESYDLTITNLDKLKNEIKQLELDSNSVEYQRIQLLFAINDSILKELIQSNRIVEYLRKKEIELNNSNTDLSKQKIELTENHEDFKADKKSKELNFYIIFAILGVFSLIFLWLSITNYKRAIKTSKQVITDKENLEEYKNTTGLMLSRTKAELSKEKSENVSTKEAYTNINKKFNILQKELYERKEQLLELNKNTALNQQFVEDTKSDIEYNNTVFENTKNELSEKIEELQNQNIELESNSQNSENELSKYKSENDYLKSKIEVFKENLAKTQREIDSLSDRVNEKMLPESRLKKDEIEINLIKLEKIERLKDIGTLNDEEYLALKNKVLELL